MNYLKEGIYTSRNFTHHLYFEKQLQIIKSKPAWPPRLKRHDAHVKTWQRYKTKRKRYDKGEYLIETYNITMDQWNTMYNEQGGSCKICDKDLVKSKAHTDHNHKTGKVRGILCGSCNRGLGLFQDNWGLLISGAKYLLKSL